jgi:hypothetical protein
MVRSSRTTKELIDEADFACRLMLPRDAMTAEARAHDFKTREGRCGGFHRLEAACRTDHPLECTVIRLNDVIQVFRRSMLDVFRQQSFILQAPDGLRVRSQIVGCDGGGRTVARRPQSFPQEAMRRSSITPACQHGGNQPTVFIDCSKQKSPSSAYSYIGLIHSP